MYVQGYCNSLVITAFDSTSSYSAECTVDSCAGTGLVSIKARPQSQCLRSPGNFLENVDCRTTPFFEKSFRRYLQLKARFESTSF